MKEFTFLANPYNPINWRATKLHEYKVYLTVRLGLQIEALMKHNLDFLLQRCPTMKQIIVSIRCRVKQPSKKITLC